MTIMKEDAEAIKVAHQVLEQVEEVVGKIKGSIALEKKIKDKSSEAVIKTLDEILILLTEEE